MTKLFCLKVGRFLILFSAISALGAMPLIAKVHGLSFYISPDGNDAWSGRIERPFATLERARNQIRKLKQQGKMPSEEVTVELAPGVYQLSQTRRRLRIRYSHYLSSPSECRGAFIGRQGASWF